jgi:hypothetical protein
MISGPPYESGTGLEEDQVIKVTSSHEFPRTSTGEEQAGPEYFITKILEVAAPSEIVCVLWGSAFDWTDYTAFYIWRLTGNTSKTRVTIESLEHADLATPIPRDEFAAYEAALVENWYRSWATSLAALRETVERDAGD